MQTDAESRSTHNIRPHPVLIVTVADAIGLARLPELLHRAGCEVTVWAPPATLIRHSRFIAHHADLPAEPDAAAATLAARLAQEPNYPYARSIVGDEPLLLALMAAACRAPALHRLLPVAPASAGPSSPLASKVNFTLAAAAAGISIPRFRICHNEAEVMAAVEPLGFPLVLKCDHGSCSQGVRVIADVNELTSAHQQLTCYDCDGPVLAQAFVAGQVGTTDILYDHGRPVCWFSWYCVECQPAKTGMSCIRTPADPPGISAIVETVGNLTGFSGFCGIDWIQPPEATAGVCVLEFNPRPTPGYHLAQYYGVDFAAAWRAMLEQRPPPPPQRVAATPKPVRMFPQEAWRCLDHRLWWLLLLWLPGLRSAQDVPWRDWTLLREHCRRLVCELCRLAWEAVRRRCGWLRTDGKGWKVAVATNWQLARQILNPGDEPAPSLRLQGLRSGFWSLVGKGGGDLLRLSGSLILTRLLFPEAFGLMATANVVLIMLQLFTDAGVRTSIIRHPKGADVDFLNSAWVMSILRGGLIFLLVLAMAPVLAKFYGQPSLLTILSILAVCPLIGGFENPALALLTKRFRLEKEVIFELSTQALGVLSSILLARAMHSVYALVLGNVLTSLYRLAGSYLVIPHRPRWTWQPEASRELISFGKAIFINTAITWLCMKLDTFLVGKLLGMEQAGLYNLGGTLGGVLASFAVAILMRAYLPAVSAIAAEPERIMLLYRRTVTLMLALALPLVLMLCLFAPDLIGVLYDPRYQQAHHAVQGLALASLALVITMVGGTTFIALGRVRYETLTMAVGSLITMLLLPLGARQSDGLAGVAAAMALAAVGTAIVNAIFLWRKLAFTPRVLLRPWWQCAAVIIPTWGGWLLLRGWLERPGLENIPFALLVLAFGSAISAITYHLLERKSTRRVGGF